MVKQKHIQVPVAVIIEEITLVTESLAVQAEFCGFFFKKRNSVGIVAFIYKQLVGPFMRG